MSSHTLAFAVRPSVVLKYIGQLFLVLACLTVVPCAVSLYFGDTPLTYRYAIVLVGLIAAGFLLRRFPQPGHIQTNEAMVIVALMFLVTPLIMAYPMTGSGISYEDAVFEAISCGTTTGLSTLSAAGERPATFFFARAWMQWYGGLGILVFALALTIRPGRLTKGLAAAEYDDEDLVGGTRAHARYVLIVYGLLTGVGILLLLLCGAGLFNATVYTFSAVSTTGFAPHDTTLSGLPAWTYQTVLLILCLGGSLSFVFYRQAYLHGWHAMASDVQTRGMVAACLLTSAGVGLTMWIAEARPWSAVVSQAPILGISAQTTAGFATVNIKELSASSKLVLILSMVVGGGVGSTAGGFKVLRLLIAFRLLSLLVSSTSMPAHALVTPRLGRERLQAAEIEQALCLILAFMALIALSWLSFLAAGYDPLDSLFEVVSAAGTVGLSTGLTGPDLPSVLKRVLCMDMLMGRLEIMAWLVLFYPRTWLGLRRDTHALSNRPRRRW